MSLSPEVAFEQHRERLGRRSGGGLRRRGSGRVGARQETREPCALDRRCGAQDAVELRPILDAERRRVRQEDGMGHAPNVRARSGQVNGMSVLKNVIRQCEYLLISGLRGKTFSRCASLRPSHPGNVQLFNDLRGEARWSPSPAPWRAPLPRNRRLFSDRPCASTFLVKDPSCKRAHICISAP